MRLPVLTPDATPFSNAKYYNYSTMINSLDVLLTWWKFCAPTTVTVVAAGVLTEMYLGKNKQTMAFNIPTITGKL